MRKTRRYLVVSLCLAFVLLLTLVLCLPLAPSRIVRADEPAVTTNIYYGVNSQYKLIISDSQTDTDASVCGIARGEVKNNTPWAGIEIISVEVKGNVKPTSTANWFKGLDKLTAVDLGGLDMSAVTDMNNMFQGCSSLANLTLPATFNTQNVTNFERAFNGCSSLTELDLSVLTMKDGATATGLILGCSKLQTIILPQNIGTGVTFNAPTNVWDGTELGKEINSARAGKTLERHDGHNFTTHVEKKDATCIEDGNKEYYQCAICQKYYESDRLTEVTLEDTVIKAVGKHDWGNGWKTTTNATKEEDGLEQRQCRRCGEIESHTIPKLVDDTPAQPDTPTQPTTPTQPEQKPSTPAKVQTGDDNSAWIVMSVFLGLVIAGETAYIIYYYVRVRRQKEGK